MNHPAAQNRSGLSSWDNGVDSVRRPQLFIHKVRYLKLLISTDGTDQLSKTEWVNGSIWETTYSETALFLQKARDQQLSLLEIS